MEWKDLKLKDKELIRQILQQATYGGVMIRVEDSGSVIDIDIDCFDLIGVIEIYQKFGKKGILSWEKIKDSDNLDLLEESAHFILKDKKKFYWIKRFSKNNSFKEKNYETFSLNEIDQVFDFFQDFNVKIELNMNDTFAWGSSWGVEIDPFSINAIVDLFKKYGNNSTIAWAAVKEKVLPISKSTLNSESFKKSYKEIIENRSFYFKKDIL